MNQGLGLQRENGRLPFRVSRHGLDVGKHALHVQAGVKGQAVNFFGEAQGITSFAKKNANISLVTVSRNFSIVSTGVLLRGDVRRTVRAVVSRERGRLELKAWDDIWERVAVPVVLEEEEDWDEEESTEEKETD